PFTITNSGSYYLTGNLTGVAGTNGITINADNVTLDLEGFALKGATGWISLSGILVRSPHKNIHITHGAVSGWATNVDAGLADSGKCERIQASSSGYDGLIVGAAGVLNDCTANNTGGDGIRVGSFCTLSSCTAEFSASNGIRAGDSCTLSSCAARNSLSVGIE